MTSLSNNAEGGGNSCADVRVLGVTPRHAQDGRTVTFDLWLEDPGWSCAAGQFVMVRPASFGLDPVWARPLSIADWGLQAGPDGTAALRLCIQVAGRGTAQMAQLRPGERVTVWGPLGSRFAVAQGQPTLLLAGGVGLAPFVGYVRRHPAPETISLLFGHRLPAEAYPLEAFTRIHQLEALREEHPGDLEAFIERLGEMMRPFGHGGLILACGPMPFLRTVQKFGLSLKARVQLSLESIMACGVGACLGCVIPRMDGTLARTCVEGPVFDAQAIDLRAPAAAKAAPPQVAAGNSNSKAMEGK